MQGKPAIFSDLTAVSASIATCLFCACCCVCSSSFLCIFFVASLYCLFSFRMTCVYLCVSWSVANPFYFVPQFMFFICFLVFFISSCLSFSMSMLLLGSPGSSAAQTQSEVTGAISLPLVVLFRRCSGFCLRLPKTRYELLNELAFSDV